MLAEVALAAREARDASDELPRVRALLKETGAKLYEPLVQELAVRIKEGGTASGAGRAKAQRNCTESRSANSIVARNRGR